MASIIFKHISIYILGFCLLYLDGMGNDSGLSFGQIWKIPIILFIAYKCLFCNFNNFTRYRLGYTLTKLLNLDIITATVSTLSGFLKFLTLPLCIPFFHNIFTSGKAIHILKLFAHVIIISFLPFFLGILEERHAYIGADLLGVNSLIGPFNNAHTSAIYLSTSVLILIFYVRKICDNKLEQTYILVT